MFLLFGCSAPPPDNLGVKNGKLAPCPNSPNCLSSQADKSDNKHYTEPFYFLGSKEEAKQKLLKAIHEAGDSKILKEDSNYIHAEFSVGFLNFLDDVEFYFPDSSERIDLRSASRLGEYDFGVNNRRVARLRKIFNSLK